MREPSYAPQLTSIRFDDAAGTVLSAYPIDDVAHDDQSTFPPWALVPFFAFFTPFFAPLAFSFPTLPILIGGYTAIAIAHFLYETLHVLHHQPYDTWWKTGCTTACSAGSGAPCTAFIKPITPTTSAT